MAEPIMIVSGLPRSGTSMMMRILNAGGVEVVTDNLREADEDNPLGYFELESVKSIHEDHSWLDEAHGRALKMVSMLLYKLPPEHAYRVIFMRRDIDEILASQRAMLQRKGESANFDAGEMKSLFLKHLDEVLHWAARQPNFSVLEISYRSVIEDPQTVALQIGGFLGKSLDMEAMVGVVNPALYRQRAAESAPPVQAAPKNVQDNDKIEAQLRALGYM